MPESAPTAGSSFVKSWVMPIVYVAGFAAGIAYLMHRYGDWSFPAAFGAILALLLGTAGYLLGMYFLYESASKRLGWQCSTGPQVRPDRTTGGVDIVIRGDYRGRPFTLSRSRSTSPGRRVTISSTLEWTGEDIRVPVFSLRVTGAFDAGLDRFVGSAAMAGAISSALGRHADAPRVELDPGSKLARRAELSAPDSAAALALLNPMRCEALDALVSSGSIHGEPGRIVLGSVGFPLPWRLEAFVARADEIRDALAG